ncbi:hypothetical protein ACFV2B_39090, partial [Streptomyces lavendulae]
RPRPPPRAGPPHPPPRPAPPRPVPGRALPPPRRPPPHVAVRDRGCVRFCYLAPGSRTPAPFHCEPAASGDPARVVPRFTSTAYGTPGYAQLSAACPPEIRRGAGDGSEPGAFHGLFQPRREDGLRGRLAEYAPAGTSCGVLFVT